LLANGASPAFSVLGLKNALSLTLSLKGEGTVRSGWVFQSQPAALELPADIKSSLGTI